MGMSEKPPTGETEECGVDLVLCPARFKGQVHNVCDRRLEIEFAIEDPVRVPRRAGWWRYVGHEPTLTLVSCVVSYVASMQKRDQFDDPEVGPACTRDPALSDAEAGPGCCR
jgi:hypothetical protein